MGIVVTTVGLAALAAVVLGVLRTGSAAGLPLRAQDALLATAGTGRGLLGGSVFAPLPVPAPTGTPAPRGTSESVRSVSA